MEFVLIPAGSFMMGTPDDEEGGREESPQHKVTIRESFYLGKHEVTQAQWVAAMESNPSKFKGQNNPVEQVSWDDAQEFIRSLNAKEGHTRYRLPTEAEWEYAARAGTSSIWFFGDDENKMSEYANYSNSPWPRTRMVGQKLPNPWGLYDIYGSVDEWVQDWFGDRYYANSPGVDPKGPSSGFERVVRGGSSGVSAWNCRSGNRNLYPPDYRLSSVGFRLALSPE